MYGRTLSKRAAILLCVLLIDAAAGCETNRATVSGPYFTEAITPNSDQAIVYFYRPPLTLNFPAGKYRQWIYDSGQLVSELDDGGYFVYKASPGPHHFTLASRPRPKDIISVELLGGETYFIKRDYQ